MKVARKDKRSWTASKPSNPTIGEVVSLEEEENSSVWKKFQYGISKEEMYPLKAPAITEVVDTMRQLPIVGKSATSNQLR